MLTSLRYDRNGKVIGVTVSDSPSLPPLGGWVTSGPLVRDPGGFLREVVEEGMVEAGPVKKKAKTKAAVRRSSRFVVCIVPDTWTT